MPVNPNRQFVESFHDGDAVAALFAIARAHGIGVHVVTVDDVAEAADRTDLTDEETAAVKEMLPGYDQWLANSGAQESIADYRYQIAEECGLVEDD